MMLHFVQISNISANGGISLKFRSVWIRTTEIGYTLFNLRLCAILITKEGIIVLKPNLSDQQNNLCSNCQQLKHSKTRLIFWGLSISLFILSHLFNFGFWRLGLLITGVLPIYSISFIIISFLAEKFSAISKGINSLVIFGYITFILSGLLLPDINLRKEKSFTIFRMITTTNDSVTEAGLLFSLFMAIGNIVLQIVLIVLMCRVKKRFSNNEIQVVS